jgi:hypothetical protein
MAGGNKHGTAYMTASGQVGKAGTPITVYAQHLISTSTASLSTLNNGGSGGTAYIEETGTVSKGVTFNYSEGFYFPGGCYFVADANLVSVLISFDQL